MGNERAVFTAQVANYLGKGNKRTDYPDGGWSWNLIELRLGRYKACLTQHQDVIRNSIGAGGLVHTTDLEILGVKKFAEGMVLTNDLCRLLSLASFSQVVPLKYSFDGHGSKHLSQNAEAMYFRPLIDIRSGEKSHAYLEKTWTPYRKLKSSRKLAEVIEMLTIAELPIQPLEVKLAQIFITMENLKGTYARSHKIPFVKGWYRRIISPKKPPNRQPTMSFEELLKEMFQDVGMKPSLRRIIQLRNEIIHFGLSRKPYKSLQKHYESCHDITREYLLRLLGYEGEYLTYSHGGSSTMKLKR